MLQARPPPQKTLHITICVRAQSCLTLQSHGLWPAKFLCPWVSLGNNTGVGCHFNPDLPVSSDTPKFDPSLSA